jgi:hypothetical protein
MATLFDGLSVGAAQVLPIVQAQPEGKGLFDAAVLLSLELRVFGTSRKLASAEYQVDADKSKTGASKRLLKSDELKAILQFDAETRRIISYYTLPSQFRSGLYVLPLASIEKVDALLVERGATRSNLVEVFAAKYPDLQYLDSLPAESGGLGAVYDSSDYPSVDEVRDAFTMTHSYTEVSAPGKLKGISMAIYEREKAKAADCWKSAIEQGEELLIGAYSGLLTHMRDRLTPGADGKCKVFRDTLVGNLKTFLDTFDARNLSQNDMLAQMVKDMSAALDGVSPKDLRDNGTIRARVTATADSIKAKLDTMLVDKPGRKINFNDESAGGEL